jgi:hypothetical protein
MTARLAWGSTKACEKLGVNSWRCPNAVPSAIRFEYVPELVAAAGECVGIRFLEYFAANIRNPTRAGPTPRSSGRRAL